MVFADWFLKATLVSCNIIFSYIVQLFHCSCVDREFDGAIASPMYPGLYPDQLDVYYYVYAPTGKLISYSFSLFDLEPPTSEGYVSNGLKRPAPLVTDVRNLNRGWVSSFSVFSFGEGEIIPGYSAAARFLFVVSKL